MKTKLLLLLLLLCIVKIQAQENKGFTIDASFGITVPVGDYKTYTKTLGQENEFNLIGFTEEITGQTQFNLDAAYYFNDFGVGASFGIFNHKISNLTYEVNFPVKTEGGKISGIYYGIGPNYTTSLGAFNFTGLVRGGLMNISLDKFIGSYSGTDVSEPVEILNTEQSPGSKSSLPYASFGVKLSYPVYEGLSAFAIAEYLTSFGDGLEILDRYVTPHDTNGDGSITSIDIDQFVNSDHLVEETRFLNPQLFYFGLGLKYEFGETDEESRLATLTVEEARKKDRMEKGLKIANNDADSDGDDFGDIDETIEFENANDKRKKHRLIAVFPKNNSSYTDATEIEKFSWELGGNQIENPHYKFEIFKIDDNQESQSVYVENTTKTETAHEVAHVLQQKLEESLNQSGEGLYKWLVTEITTGFTSNKNFFSISRCDFDFSISNETIECLSYDTDNRTLKICFDSVFSSPSALVDLTFFDQQSGLILYDQNINGLTYHLGNPNQQLMPQSGTGGATPYCLEVTVPNSVTSLTLRLQGDVINAGSNKCIPLVEFTFNDLPNCYCDDCDDINLTLDNPTISPNGANGNQFAISGNLTASTPIYGIEFQIQSMTYTANPSSCTKGVSSIEESGMFILPGTTINGSTSVQVYNETISSSSNTNNFTAKTVQYKNISPIAGAIPLTLNIGLPGTLPGLDASCCQINYTVCIKAKIYLENGNCKSCVFTHCFSFTNQ